MIPHRIRLPAYPRLFGQVRKIGREWHAEVRRTDTGDIVRPAGIWSTKAEAIAECEYEIPRTPLIGD